MKTYACPYFALVVVTLIVSACSGLPVGLGVSARAASSAVLFQDDFSEPWDGWSMDSQPDYFIGYEKEAFRIWGNQPNFDYFSVPGLSFADVRLEVNATRAGGPEDNNYGMICRYQDENNFYGFLISSDGYYGISIRENGDHTILGMEGMKVSQTIRTGDGTNHIRADCIGSKLTLYVNGEKLVEVQDSRFARGDVGLLAGSFDEPGVDITFDNFLALKP